jgi:hypothetical protein
VPHKSSSSKEKSMKKTKSLFRPWLLALVLAGSLGAVGTAAAKLPVPAETPEAKAKAQEEAAKAAAAAKQAAEDLARYQDKAVANYKERQPK